MKRKINKPMRNIMPYYKRILKHPKWFEKRKSVLMRDEYKCLICGSEDNLLVHHRQYHIDKKTGRFILPWEYKLKYLITTCKNCHEKGHSIYKVPVFKI